ncbi:MAG: hypothetical protein M3Z33_02770 [Actinomycetota bacterium]|nr:hypothetical protein [Actinomycetota bacterium]
MVRGPAAVLTAYAGALLYFEIAPSLPALRDGDITTIASGALGMAALALGVFTLVPARQETGLLVVLLAGGGLLAGALQVADAGPAAEVAKLLFAGVLGMLLARALDTPAVIIAVPLFVAGIELAGVLGAPGAPLVHRHAEMVNFVTFPLPRWGGGGASQLAMSDLVFLGFYVSAAWRYGFRRRATAVGLSIALLGTLVAGVALGQELPVLPALALGLLAPNLDRLKPLLSGRGGEMDPRRA